jgi:hypothetical protein
MSDFEDRIRVTMAAKARQAPDPARLLTAVRARVTDLPPERPRRAPVLLSTGVVLAALGLVFYLVGDFETRSTTTREAIEPRISPPVGPTNPPPTDSSPECAGAPFTLHVGHRTAHARLPARRATVVVRPGQVVSVVPQQPGGCATLIRQRWTTRDDTFARAVRSLYRGPVTLQNGEPTRPSWDLLAVKPGRASFHISFQPPPCQPPCLERGGPFFDFGFFNIRVVAR